MTLFEQVDNLHNKSANYSIKSIPIHHQAFKAFSTAVFDFQRSLGENAESDEWRAVLGALKRFRYLACIAPLPFESPQFWTDSDDELIKTQIIKTKSLFPIISPQLKNLHESIQTLRNTAENPLLNAMQQNPSTGTSAIVLTENKLLAATSELTKNLGIKVVRPADLKKYRCFETLFICGASTWLPEFVLSAPRANQIIILKYSWLIDRKSLPQTFETITNKARKTYLTEATNTSQELNIDIQPKLNWSALTRVSVPNEQDRIEQVEAKLFILEGDTAVYLPVETNARVLAVDPIHREVQLEYVTKLRRNNFVLVRTGGGGDYVVDIANQLLGKDAINYRNMQEKWKRMLHKHGDITVLSEKLLALGAVTAQPHNVRNWLSSRNIKPRDKKDFKAIMTLIKKEKEYLIYWSIMNRITNFHRKAGRFVRQQLLEQVEKADMQALEEEGYMNFELNGVKGVSMSLCRIIEIAPDVTEIAFNQLSKPFDLQGEKWLE